MNGKNRAQRLALRAAFVVIAIGASTPMFAQFSTNITDIVTNATSLFSSVQSLVLSILTLGIGVWVVNKLRRR